jgi:Ca-activated chloride channel family protein
MSFLAPVWLAGLVLIPLAIAASIIARRRARRYAVRFTGVGTLREIGSSGSWRRLVPAACLLASMAALVVALARPVVSRSVATRQAAVMLVMDESGSMASTDVSPTRLGAAEQAADRFIGRLPSPVRVGAVAFSSSINAAQAPVAAHSGAQAIIDNETANGGTATGNALALALQMLHGSQRGHTPAAIVLLSDGAANEGVNVITVAQEAAHERIPIDTIALGTPGGTLQNPDPLGAPISVPPDPQLMQAIARASDGHSFSAHSAAELDSIYHQLGSRIKSVTRRQEITVDFALAGLALLLVASVASIRWSPRLP